MIDWIKRQYDKTRSCNQFVQWGHCNSKWYVQYSETERSVTMLYGTAKNYASIFGGSVKHITQ